MVEIVKGARKRKMPAFLFVNNRLEGNAPGTIEAVVVREKAPGHFTPEEAVTACPQPICSIADDASSPSLSA